MMDRVNNVEKDRKRKASSEDDLPRKRGCPKKMVTSSSRYPPLTVDPSDISQEKEALEKELKKEKPRRDVLLDLMKATYYSRRREILHDSDTVSAKVATYPALKMPSVVSFLHLTYTLTVRAVIVLTSPRPVLYTQHSELHVFSYSCKSTKHSIAIVLNLSVQLYLSMYIRPHLLILSLL